MNSSPLAAHGSLQVGDSPDMPAPLPPGWRGLHQRSPSFLKFGVHAAADREGHLPVSSSLFGLPTQLPCAAAPLQSSPATASTPPGAAPRPAGPQRSTVLAVAPNPASPSFQDPDPDIPHPRARQHREPRTRQHSRDQLTSATTHCQSRAPPATLLRRGLQRPSPARTRDSTVIC